MNLNALSLFLMLDNHNLTSEKGRTTALWYTYYNKGREFQEGTYYNHRFVDVKHWIAYMLLAPKPVIPTQVK